MYVNGEEIKMAASQLKKVITKCSAKGCTLKLKVIKLCQPSLMCLLGDLMLFNLLNNKTEPD